MSLYIIATPIGNTKDITLRALEVLGQVDLVLCEDTRHSGQLLHQYNIKKPLLSFHEHNEERRIPEIITRLKKEEDIALISDSGTPLISDPGFKLVRTAHEQGIDVKAVPGPSAAVAAMSIAGLPTDKFLFVGYLPKTSGKRQELLQKLLAIRRELALSLIFYESPHRLRKTLEELAKYFPDNQLSLQRELTKMHEEVKTATVGEMLKSNFSTKGEFTLVIY